MSAHPHEQPNVDADALATPDVHDVPRVVAAAGEAAVASSLAVVDPSRREIVAAGIDLARKIAASPGYDYELDR